MVVFTCNNCGDSLQKPKVEKHYATACRTFKNLTCVDCLKDFKGEDYAAHIKCVSEKERYAAKGAAVNVVNKGEVKQQQWSDMILELVNTKTDLTAPQKIVFEIISNHIINVPRKKIKFMNFIKNAGGNRIMYPDIEKVWDIIEEYKATQTTFESTSDDPNTTEEANPEDNVEIPKKKVKKTKKTIEGNITKEDDETHNPSEDQVKPKKKKKSKTTEENGLVEATTQAVLPEENVKKSSKKRKLESKNIEESKTEVLSPKKQKNAQNDTVDNTAEEMEIDNNLEQSVTNGSLEKKKKKKAKKSLNENVVPDDNVNGKEPELPVVNGNSQKKKKNKKSHQENGEHDKNELEEKKNVEESNEETTNVTSDSISPGDVSNSVESLSDKILKLLKKKGSFSVAKLQKKVLKEYCQESGVEETPKLIKKFNKQLKKVQGVEIIDDNVRLVQV